MQQVLEREAQASVRVYAVRRRTSCVHRAVLCDARDEDRSCDVAAELPLLAHSWPRDLPIGHGSDFADGAWLQAHDQQAPLGKIEREYRNHKTKTDPNDWVL